MKDLSILEALAFTFVNIYFLVLAYHYIKQKFTDKEAEKCSELEIKALNDECDRLVQYLKGESEASAYITSSLVARVFGAEKKCEQLLAENTNLHAEIADLKTQNSMLAKEAHIHHSEAIDAENIRRGFGKLKI